MKKVIFISLLTIIGFFLFNTLSVAAGNTICPVMGGNVNKNLYADVKGYRIYVCCPLCIKAVKEDPDKYIKKLKASGQSLEMISTKDNIDGKKNNIKPNGEKLSLIVKTIDGETLDIGKLSYKKPVLLNFWAVWCPYCLNEVPHMGEFNRKFSDKIVPIGIATNYRESKDAVKKFVKVKNLGYRISYDENGRLFKKYKVQGIPAFFVIKNGKSFPLNGIPSEDKIKEILNW